MSGSFQAGFTLALCVATAVPVLASGQVRPRPAVVIALDIADTMNLGTDSAAPPDCAAGERSRYQTALEGLTGTLNDYSCNLQNIPPYPGAPDTVLFPAPSSTSQNADGLIDRYSADVRFGLLAADTLADGSAGSAGAYSYGVSFPGGGNPIDGINLGARNPVAPNGQLLGIGPPGLGANVVAHNQEVQQQLAIIPFGKASLAALLEDASYYFDNEATVQPDNPDYPENACRDMRVVLITDGASRPDYDDHAVAEGDEANALNQHGSAVDRAAELANRGVTVHVLLVSPGADAAAIAAAARMDEIAAAGGSESAGVVRQAFKISAYLDDVLNFALEGTDSRTRSANSFQTFDNDIGNLQTFAGYSVDGGGGPWQGHFVRVDYECGTGLPKTVFNYGTDLPVGVRKIYTTIDGLRATFDVDNASITDSRLNVPAAERDPLIDFVHGRDGGAFGTFPHKLGAILRSDPVIVGPPLLNLPFPSYRGGFVDANGNAVQGYKDRDGIRDRPTVGYVGASDGRLHAFVLATPVADQALRDTELWSFMPGPILGQMRPFANNSGVVPYVDGPPAAATVRLTRSQLFTPDQEVWADVLVGGGGEGGRYYYALDVSYPNNPQVLWELSGKEYEGVPGATLDALDNGNAQVRRLLGKPTAKPAFGTVVVAENGVRVERAVAFLSGGRPAGDALDDPDQGKAFYVVQVEPEDKLNFPGRPKILRSFTVDQGLIANSGVDEMRFPIVGSPVAYQGTAGAQTTRVFVGDAGGQLWRIDLTSTNPAAWRMERVYDPYLDDEAALAPGDPSPRRPATHRPALATQPDGTLVVIHATGDRQDLQANEDKHRVLSLEEKILFDANFEVTGVEMTPNWIIPLQPGEQTSASPIIFGDTVYFATLLFQNGSVCGLGQARIWGVRYPKSTAATAVNGVEPMFPARDQQARAGFVEQNPPRCDQEIAAADAPDRRAMYCVLDGAIIAGLEVVSVPNCEDDIPDDAAAQQAGAAPGATPQLIAQTGGFTPGLGGGGALPQFGGKSPLNILQKKLRLPAGSAIPLMWGVVYE